MADVDVPNSRQETPLHIACRKSCQFSLVRSLLDCGAQAHKRDRIGQSPLHVACLNGSVATVRAILEAAGLATEPDNDLMTPMHAAAISGNCEVITLLMELGAQVDPLDKDG